MPFPKYDASDMEKGSEGFIIDTEAQRMMREKFGCEKPIPAATMHRSIRIQEACRLYIHNFWEFKRCAQFAGCSEVHLSRICDTDGWDYFASLISQEMKPSVWVASDIEIPDINLIQREKKRRVDDIEMLLAEEKKILETMSITKAGTKEYNMCVGSLKEVRKLIDDATGASYYHAEQSAGRKALMNRAINRKEDPPADDMKTASGSVVDVS